MMNWVADRYFHMLCLLLLGYAMIGKGFAYLGAPPLFVGEMVLGLGIFAWMASENWSFLLRTYYVWPIILFMGWCAHCTTPYIGRYGPDALRDAAVWGWGLFAIVSGSLLCADPRRLTYLVFQFKKFAWIFLIFAPLTWILSAWGNRFLPDAPWAHQPLFNVKGGDQIVHLTAIFAYVILAGEEMSPWMVAVTSTILLIMNFTGRAAMVTFVPCVFLLFCMRPFHKVIWSLLTMAIVGLGFLWLAGIDIPTPGENHRNVSATQIVENVVSIFSDSDNQNLSGSKEWRLKWWDTIFGYTLHGKYFWTGKGFGVNLADDDGFQVEKDHSLRSPHNGHITMLARAGVPGFCLWIFVQGSWGLTVFWYFIRARWKQEYHWANLFMVLFIYWVAFMTNAAFDVYLEGPLGGIWMWSVYGIGLGSLWIFDHCPQTLDQVLPEEEFEPDWFDAWELQNPGIRPALPL